MEATPTIAGNEANELWAVLVEAVSTTSNSRTQFLLFSPAAERHGAPSTLEGRSRLIKRRLEYAGHRAKWQTIERASAEDLAAEVDRQLQAYERMDWIIRQPILIRLEADDYVKAWQPGGVDTPYKALRHVEKVAQQRGYRLSN